MPERPVEFAIALAPDWEQIDLLGPDAGEVLDEPLAAALRHGAEGGEHARILMARSLYMATPEGRPLGAGLSVMLADPDAPVTGQALSADAFAGADVAAIALPVGSGLRVRRLTPDDETGASVVSVQYLLQTGDGLLTITLSTPQASHTEEWEQLFDAMARTAELG